MNSWLGKGILVVATLVLVLSGLAWAAVVDDGCSNATLTGDYGSTISGQSANPDGTTSAIAGVVMGHFDGAGKFTQVDFVMVDGKPLPGYGDATTGFHFQPETGTYTVHPDCTGSMEIDFPPPPGLSSGGVIKVMFVLSNHGRAIHSVVAENTPPGATAPALVTTRADGYKLGSVGNHEDGDHE